MQVRMYLNTQAQAQTQNRIGTRLMQKKELLYEVYELITDNFKDWRDIANVIRKYTNRYEKHFLCELELLELKQVRNSLKVEINYWKGKTRYVK